MSRKLAAAAHSLPQKGEDRHTNWKRLMLDVLLALYLAALLRITVFRPGFLLPQNDVRPVNLLPLNAYRYWVRVGSWRVFWVDLIGNLACFCPFGMILALLRPECTLLRAAGSGFALSLCIEVSQYLLGTGIADVDDLVLNTLGVMLGALLMKYLLAGKETI